MVVTARLAKPWRRTSCRRLPTDDELNDPNDFELFLLGSQGGGGQARERATRTTRQKLDSADADAPGAPEPAPTHRSRGPSGELGFIR